MVKEMAMEKFPDVVKKLWSGWEIRVLVSVSLLLQIILIILGSKRRYTSNALIGILVWLSYLSADSVATFAVGNLATNKTDCSPNASNLLQAFWAPFLLLHLGGPDTITAYSLEDNELWLRHLLGLLVQLGGAFYVFRRFLMSNSIGSLAYVSIPMFVAGILKYGERTWVLRSSSANNLTDSMRATPEFGITDDDPPPSSDHSDANSPKLLFREADYLFKRCKYIFAELSLPLDEIKNCVSIVRKKETEDAFKLVAIELGFMYDLLYTKSTSAFSKHGIFVRCISSASTVGALIASIFAVDKHPYPVADTIITYLLLGGAICLEFYAIIMLILSDRTCVLVSQKELPDWIPRSLMLNLSKRKRWSESIPQLSLMDIILEAKMKKWVQKSFGIIENLQISRLSNRTDVTADVQNLIFAPLIYATDELARSGFASYEYISLSYRDIADTFDRGLIILLLTTELCYDHEISGRGVSVDELEPRCKFCKCLSGYLLYLLVKRPSMLPKGGRDTWYRDTCATTMRYFDTKKFRNTSEACKELLLAEVEHLESIERRENKNNSALSVACRVTKRLKDAENRWKEISEQWFPLLMFVASECRWKEHGQQLGKGGELLTHVSLLMAHLGLAQQFYDTYNRFYSIT